MVRTKLMRYTQSDQFSIVVTFPNGDEANLWHGLIGFCSKKYSNNELCQMWKDCNDQIMSMNPNNVSLIFREMMTELSQVMINRKLYGKEEE